MKEVFAKVYPKEQPLSSATPSIVRACVSAINPDETPTHVGTSNAPKYSAAEPSAAS
jgi:hypothetical protein